MWAGCSRAEEGYLCRLAGLGGANVTVRIPIFCRIPHRKERVALGVVRRRCGVGREEAGVQRGTSARVQCSVGISGAESEEGSKEEEAAGSLAEERGSKGEVLEAREDLDREGLGEVFMPEGEKVRVGCQ